MIIIIDLLVLIAITYLKKENGTMKNKLFIVNKGMFKGEVGHIEILGKKVYFCPLFGNGKIHWIIAFNEIKEIAI